MTIDERAWSLLLGYGDQAIRRVRLLEQSYKPGLPQRVIWRTIRMKLISIYWQRGDRRRANILRSHDPLQSAVNVLRALLKRNENPLGQHKLLNAMRAVQATRYWR